MSREYEDFDLVLTWSPGETAGELGRIAVHRLGGTGGKPRAYANDDRLAQFIKYAEMDETWHLSELFELGQQIADLLLPEESGIRREFRTLWQEKRAVRLRLIYPDPEISAAGAGEEQLKQILKIPWELVYLPLQAGAKDDRAHFLGRRTDISIVHSLKEYPSKDARPPALVDRLPVVMEYLSWVDPDQNHAEDRSLFQDFVKELPGLRTIIDCVNVGDNISDPGQTVPETILAEPEDVRLALVNDDLLHLVGHGDGEHVALKNAPLTVSDFLKPPQFMGEQRIDVKAAILISCNSGDGAGSVAAALHQAGVPIVISMTRWVPTDHARPFVDGFYKYIARQPLDGLEGAVANGRRSMFTEGENANEFRLSFCLPRLFLNSNDGILTRRMDLFGAERMLDGFDDYIDRLAGEMMGAPDRGNTQQNLASLKDWVQQGVPEPGWYFVVGRSGSGKSTLIARLIKDLRAARTPKLIPHFCRPNLEPEIGNPGDLLVFVRHSLVPQLIRFFAEHERDYYDFVPPGRIPLTVGNADLALREFVLNPLERLKADWAEFRPPVIVIDDIDYIPSGRSLDDSILGLLHRNWHELTNVARFLITADPVNGRVKATLAELGLDKPDLIVTPAEMSFEAIRRRFGKILDTSVKIPLELAASPRGLDILYEQAIAAVTQNTPDQTQAEKVRRLLDVVVVAFEPLLRYDVAALVDSNTLEAWWPTLEPFFEDRGDGGVLVLYHPSLEEYLLREIERQNREADIHGLFVEAFRPAPNNKTGKINWSDISGTDWAARTEAGPTTRASKSSSRTSSLARYARRYLAHHAYRYYQLTGPTNPARRQRATAFLGLICDPGFRAVRLLEVRQNEAVQDVWKGLRVVYTEYVRHLAPQGMNDKARLALDRLLDANEPGSYRSYELVRLEQRLRVDPDAGVSTLFEFLGLDTVWWDAQGQGSGNSFNSGATRKPG